MLVSTQPWKANARQRFKLGLTVFKAQPPLRLSEWAEQNFYLSSESSYVSGSWKAYPYQVGILDFFGNDDIPEVSFKKAARTGFTKTMMAASAYFTIYRKRNQAIWQPTDSDASEFCQTEFDPMLRDVRVYKPVFPALGKKHPHNTNAFKKFTGSVLYLKGGTSARNFRRISVDVAIIDEVSSFDSDVDGEGSPRKLAKKRTEGATFPKLIVGSTPKMKYTCEIDAAIQEADAVYRFVVPCPHCGTYQALEFGSKNTAHGLKWLDQDPDTAAYS
jgi:phage terminase large subunit GpA-like protein